MTHTKEYRYIATDGHRLAISALLNHVQYAKLKDGKYSQAYQNAMTRPLVALFDTATAKFEPASFQDTDFPDFQQVLPKQHNNKLDLRLDSGSFVSMLKLMTSKPTVFESEVSAKKKDAKAIVVFDFAYRIVRSPKTALLYAEMTFEDAGIIVHENGDTNSFCVNARYLLEPLLLYHKLNTPVVLHFSDAYSPIEIAHPDHPGDRHVIMPMLVNEANA